MEPKGAPVEVEGNLHTPYWNTPYGWKCDCGVKGNGPAAWLAHLRGGVIDKKPNQQILFNPNEQPTRHWCWFIEYRLQHPEYMLPDQICDTVEPRFKWGEWGLVVRPNHYRDEEKAHARVEELKKENQRPAKLGLIEFRVTEKYLGYIPDSDEAWIV